MPKKTKYILLGGNGFIGSSLIQFIPVEQLVVIGRKLELPGEEKYKYFSILQHSLDEIAGLLADTYDYLLIDLSYNSVSNTNPVHPGKDFSENLNLVIDNLHFAKKIKASLYIYLSSGGTVYGRTLEKIITESHPTNPVSHYGIIKLAAEKYVQMYCNQNGMPYQIIRPSNVYGPGQIPFRGQGIVSTVLASVIHARPFIIYGKGENVRDYIYVDDFCKWLIALISNGKSGEIYNAGSGKGHSIMELLDLIKKTVGNKDELILDFTPERSFDVKLNVLDNRKISQSTKINQSIGLEEGLNRTWGWIRDHF
jgi:UDP-glucose 4-epimerase